MIIEINHIPWEIVFLDGDDEIFHMPNGTWTIGVTDLNNYVIYVAYDLDWETLYSVLSHEICHAWVYSYTYGLEPMCEEFACQMVADDSDEIQMLTDYVYQNM